jgi:hypothetical protein
VTTTPEDLPDDIAALQAALVVERAKRIEEAARAARVEAELAVAKAKASDDQAVIAHQLPVPPFIEPAQPWKLGRQAIHSDIIRSSKGELCMAEHKTINGSERGSISPLSAARAEQPKKVLPPALAKHAFRPGQSGNPGGRTPMFAEYQRLARQASLEAMRRLIELIGSSDERVALMAADKVLERAWGKPKVQEEDESPFQNMTREERNRRVLELLAFAATLEVPEGIAVEEIEEAPSGTRA